MASDRTTSGPRRLRFTLINRDYTRLWYGQATSSLGDSVFSTTVVLWIVTVLAKGKPWAPAAVSTALLAIGLAVLVIGPIAGVFVDRWDSRLTMIRADQFRCAIVGLMTALSFLPTRVLPVGAWLGLICVLLFALNAVGQFFGPARYTLIRDIVTSDTDRARAAGIAQATGQVTLIAGPPLAAPLLFAVGVQWGLLFNAMSYAVSFAFIRTIHQPPRPHSDQGSARRAGFRAEFAAGLRVFRDSRFLMALLMIILISQVGAGALNTLDVFFVKMNLHAPLRLYGFLGTSLGIGGIGGALIAGRLVQRIGARATAWTGLIASGVLMIAYSRQTSFLAAVAMLFLAAIPMTALNTAMAPLIMSAAPRQYMGRVSAVLQPSSQLALLLAAQLTGWLASTALRNFSVSVAGLHLGPIDTIFSAAGLLIVLAGVYAQRALPEVTGPAEPEPAAPPPAAQAAGEPETSRL